MILYAVSGAERSGKTTLCRRLVGAVNVWSAEGITSTDLLISRLRIIRAMVADRVALDGIPSLDVLEAIRVALPNDTIVHFHVTDGTDGEIDRASNELIALGIAADYSINWKRVDA